MSKKNEILKAAENRAREGGYNNFSFREIAKEVGIKSASVHYYFPTKADLGSELAEAYTDNFMSALGDIQVLIEKNKDPIEVYTEQFRNALVRDKRMCLCGLFGAESDILPEPVHRQTRRFFELNVQWLQAAYLATVEKNSEIARKKAIILMAQLEGAMMISKTMQDETYFDVVIEQQS